MIEEAILDADKRGIKVVSLGLMNQGEELNIYGGLYVSRHPKLNVKVVDGSSLAVAAVINSIPKGTTQVLLRGKLTKVAYALAYTLGQQGVQVNFLFFFIHSISCIVRWCQRTRVYFKLFSILVLITCLIMYILQIATMNDDDYVKLKKALMRSPHSIVNAKSFTQMVI